MEMLLNDEASANPWSEASFRKEFMSWLDSVSSGRNIVLVNRARADRIIQVLKDDKDVPQEAKRFRQTVKEGQYKLVDCPRRGNGSFQRYQTTASQSGKGLIRFFAKFYRPIKSTVL